jgi:hypothetical protein
MSAAATAAGYLYASGRLRGRGGREGEPEGLEHPQKKEASVKRREPRIAVYEPDAPQRPDRPKRVPKVEYRVRRWKPE